MVMAAALYEICIVALFIVMGVSSAEGCCSVRATSRGWWRSAVDHARVDDGFVRNELRGSSRRSASDGTELLIVASTGEECVMVGKRRLR